ncbi:glycosyl hydrolase family 1 [Melghirimyces profundicolus]|uniref:Glycosyl hydrolase family 1 n=1 Tax=Melghirimyces profundicolus TaxID=1242148 RepID=A0A2T6C7Y8_9BACL|nr:family 1 glycosylhydrolase [Melghirimyces profundicolus]PTX64438.1 glycosyl hydrolase family 1 [Melghirimyces profundicolus]
MKKNDLLQSGGNAFFWATGIEDTFIPQSGPGKRALDEYELTDHYNQWRKDLDRAAELGVSMMRYGVPWYRVNPAPGVFDWGWMDRVLEYMVQEKGIVPIVDLMHYGTPLWLEDQFIHPDYEDRVSEYAMKFAERYRGLVRYYTPLNEPYVNAEFCGEIKRWPPCLEGERGFVAIMRNLCRGIIKTVRGIRSVDPDSVMVHVDATGWFYPGSPELAEKADHLFHKRLLCFDLISGRVDEGHILSGWLAANGLVREELEWFRRHAISLDIVGVNYYPELSVFKVIEEDGTVTLKPVWGGTEGLKTTISAYYNRYRRPIFLTETSTNEKVASRERWLSESVQAIRELREEGIPVIGYTWWPLYDLVNWDYREGDASMAEYIEPMGLWSLEEESGLWVRKPLGVVSAFKEVVRSAEFPPVMMRKLDFS